ncbi:MAG: hypothetical protein LBB47_08045 [Spirochaetaceae bacterium]|nr:hypothetical protein [Spirochaetaceae bacterium]
MENYKEVYFKKFGLTLVILLALMTAGCATRLGAFTVISTKSIDWSRSSEFKRSNQKVEGNDIYHMIIYLPTKFNVTIESAVDNALEQVPGAIALVDAVLSSKRVDLLFYGNDGYYITGTVLIDPSLVSSNDTVKETEETKFLAFYTENGKNFTKKEISESEYLSYAVE